jgi:carbonic anhydrase/acetyltransferase-like protein (isoleucine patch superfamily)
MLHPFKGHLPTVAESAYIVASAQVIGEVTIGEESSLWFYVVVRGDVNRIDIGARTNIQDGSVVHVTHKKHPTQIGDDVTVGHNVTLHGCQVGNRCLIGMGAVVMDGAVIEDDAMIAAGALVAPGTRVQSKTLYAGIPAKFKRKLTNDEIAGLKQSAQNYLGYVEDYRS